MSGIRQPILDVLTRLAAINVVNSDYKTVPLYVRRFKNQINREKDGSGGVYPKPAVFVQYLQDVTFEQAGVGILSADLGFRLHVVKEFYNDEDSVNFGDDLAIYDLCDRIASTTEGLSQFCPTACGTLNRTSISQDQDPDNVDIIIIDFVCNFIDSKGSKLDEGQGTVYEVTADLDSTLDVTFNIPQ